MNMAYVNKYRTPELWDNINDEQYKEISNKIIPLIPSIQENSKIKLFDKEMLIIEERLLVERSKGSTDSSIQSSLSIVIKRINNRIDSLLKIKSIPEILNHVNSLKELYDCKSIFENFSLEQIEKTRKELRNLMIYLPDYKEFVVFSLDDYLIDNPVSTAPREKTYKEKVDEYLADTRNPILAKIMNLDELTKDEQEELNIQFTVNMGSTSEFNNISHGLGLLPYIRLQIGFTNEAVINKFGSFLNSSVLDSQQLEFCNQIIEYTKINGDFTPLLLQTVSPFCDVDVVNVFGTKFMYIRQLISGLHKPVEWKR